MLILTRRIGETLRIGDEVVVTVLGMHGNQVKLGIDAPKHVAVMREELLLRDQRRVGSDEGQGDGDRGASTEGGHGER